MEANPFAGLATSIWQTETSIKAAVQASCDDIAKQIRDWKRPDIPAAVRRPEMTDEVRKRVILELHEHGLYAAVGPGHRQWLVGPAEMFEGMSQTLLITPDIVATERAAAANQAAATATPKAANRPFVHCVYQDVDVGVYRALAAQLETMGVPVSARDRAVAGTREDDHAMASMASAKYVLLVCRSRWAPCGRVASEADHAISGNHGARVVPVLPEGGGRECVPFGGRRFTNYTGESAVRSLLRRIAHDYLQPRE